ncbi:MAG: DUF5012 domain-containing protein [Bacteroidaceae bacterium]|nr:DUF5012 domain-containing protein [Bacteroidaceae bacterium]
MKKTLYTLMLCLATMTFVSCEDETSQDLSVVTHYVTLELNGDALTLVPLGSSYTDEGVVAMEGTKDVSSNVEVTNPVNANEVGIYTVTYTAINKDGFPSSITRTVAVYDPTVTANIAGTYTVDANRTSGATVTAYSGFTVSLTQAAPGIYWISDYLGGFYEQGRGYGASYALAGYIKLNADNTVEALTGYVKGWGDSYSSVNNGVYDPAVGRVSFDVVYAGMLFSVTLNK